MPTTEKNHAIENAIAYLGAVKVAPGRYAFKDRCGPGYRTASEKRMEEYDYTENPLSLAMPAWWTPERRFAWRIIGEAQR